MYVPGFLSDLEERVIGARRGAELDFTIGAVIIKTAETTSHAWRRLCQYIWTIWYLKRTNNMMLVSPIGNPKRILARIVSFEYYIFTC
jgi:hypothetical protein